MKEYELYTGAYTGSKEEAGRFCGLENPSYVLPWEDRLYTGEMFLFPGVFRAARPGWGCWKRAW